MEVEVKEKKNKRILEIIFLILIVVFVAIVAIVIINCNKVEHYQKDEVKEEFKSLDLQDELVQKGFEMINVEHYENINSNIIEVFYSGDVVKASSLSDEQKMFLTLNYYIKLQGYYMCGEEFTVKISDLSKLFFENDNFISNFKRNTEVDAGYFTLKYNKDFTVETMGCYGMEGPISDYKVKLDNAKKSDDTLLIDVKLAYLYKDFNTYDEEKNTFYAIGYKDLEAKDKVQDKILADEDIEWEKYNEYQFTFKIDNDNLYFEEVRLV